MTIALNDPYPEPFAGLDHKTARDVAHEALWLAAGPEPTLAEVWHARDHVAPGLPQDAYGTAICPRCDRRPRLVVVR